VGGGFGKLEASGADFEVGCSGNVAAVQASVGDSLGRTRSDVKRNCRRLEMQSGQCVWFSFLKGGPGCSASVLGNCP
jgi:hypothetical protein